MNGFALRAIFQEGVTRYLQWVNTTAIGPDVCRIKSNSTALTPDEIICSLHYPDHDACNPVGAGGLITPGAKPVLLGVYISEYERCPSEHPTFYVRVFPHLSFIRLAMQ